MIHLNNILNILKLGNNWLNYKHSEKTKNLISELMKGKRKSEIHKINISKYKQGLIMLNKPKSEETKLKISLALKIHPSLKFSYKKYKPIIMTDINGNTIKTFQGVGVRGNFERIKFISK